MKYELDAKTPKTMEATWPGEFENFSTMDVRTGIPSVMFLVTTRKENGNANACLHAWSAFSGDVSGMYAVMCGLMPGGHTYRNIQRDREFCINFMAPQYLDACNKTIAHNGEENDELEAAGLTAEPAKTVQAPRVREAFLTLECTLLDIHDVTGEGKNFCISGRVCHAAMDKSHKGLSDFMVYQNGADKPDTGEARVNNFGRIVPIENAD